MMFDIGVVGVGVSGAFALQNYLNSNSKKTLAVFDAGRPGGKRRHQMFGFLGCLPGSDGKLYTNDLQKVCAIAGVRQMGQAFQHVLSQLSTVTPLKLTKDTKLSLALDKKVKKHGFAVKLNDFYQIYPKDIHSLSRKITDQLENNKNIFTSFDNEVFKVLKHKNHFSILTADGDFECRQILISVGRGGWRWVSELFSNFGIVENNDTAKFGIRVEMPAPYLKEFHHSNCSLLSPSLDVGPFSWNGTVIPEDHLDLVITSFRSNETRWHSDKVSFNLLMKQTFKDNAYQQLDRLGKLTFILSNDRVMKERISTLMNGRSKISDINEYAPLLPLLENLNQIIPELTSKASFYAPTLMPLPPRINVKADFSTEVADMWVSGEAAGIHGILGAATSGYLAMKHLVDR